MSILVPLNNAEALDSYIDAGAREFYLGLSDETWTRFFGTTADLNRLSGFGSQANAYCLDDALAIAKRCRERGVSLFIPFNTASYSALQLDYIASVLLPSIVLGDIDGVILSGPELIQPALELGLTTVASTMCGIFNSDIAQFYVDAGIDRIIFPRELSTIEIQRIVERFPELSFEVFMMRNGCIFSDSHCLGAHRAGHYSLCRDLCKAPYWNEIRPHSRIASDISQVSQEYRELFTYACGICALWRFVQMGIDAYKIVGRCDEPDDLLADIRLVKRHLEYALSCKSEEEYLRMIDIPPESDLACASQRNCYYPEIKRI